MTQQTIVVQSNTPGHFQQAINDVMLSHTVFATQTHYAFHPDGDASYVAILFHNGARK